MNKYITLVFVVLVGISVYAQEGCPTGFSEREVLCEGKKTRTCVPDNYKCSWCWEIKWYCSNEKSEAMESKSTYEAAKIYADKLTSKNACIPGNNLEKVEIYLNDKKFCSSSKNDTSLSVITKDEVKKKTITFLERYKTDLAEAIARYKGYTGNSWPPQVGKTTTEWASNIQDGFRKSNQLEKLLDNLNTLGPNDLAEQFQNIEKNYNNFKSAENSFEQKAKNKSNNSDAWITLPDGTFYKILPNGMYSFFDGIDQIETWSAEEGKEKVDSYYKNSTNNLNNNEINNPKNNSSKTKLSNISNKDYKKLQEEIYKLEGVIKQLKSVNDGSNTENIRILEQQLNLLKQEINKQ